MISMMPKNSRNRCPAILSPSPIKVIAAARLMASKKKPARQQQPLPPGHGYTAIIKPVSQTGKEEHDQRARAKPEQGL